MGLAITFGFGEQMKGIIMKEKGKRIVLVIGLLIWLVSASICYGINGYLGIAVMALGAVIFYIYRRRERKGIEKTAPKGGLYVGLQHGVIYRTAMSIPACLVSLQQKGANDPLEYDFGWDAANATGALALYCKKGGLRPSNFPSSFVVSFSNREDGVWILVRYLDPNAPSSVMTRVDVDGFFKEKCDAVVIGMRKPPQE